MLNIYFLSHAYHISSIQNPVMAADDFGVQKNFPLPQNVLMDSTGLENGSRCKMHIVPSGWLVTTSLLFGLDCQEDMAFELGHSG